jgi:DNA-nicking Smr family endonuclease
LRKKTKISAEERDLFQTEMHKHSVTPLQPKARQPKPIPEPNINPPPVPKAIISSQPPPTSVSLASVQSEDTLQFRRSGLQTRVMQRLRRGDYPIEAVLDLHGYTVNQAFDAFEQFLLQARSRSWRCVLIVHGKTARGESQVPILKNRVNQWLREESQVLAFCSAKQNHGGVGAVYVLLRP